MTIFEFENLTKNWNEWSKHLLGSIATDGGLPELRARVEDISIESFIEHAVVTLSVEIAESFILPAQWQIIPPDRRNSLATALFTAMRFGKDRGDGVKTMEHNGETIAYLIQDGEKYTVYHSILLKDTPFESSEKMLEYLESA